MTDLEIYKELVSESFTFIDDLSDSLYKHQKNREAEGLKKDDLHDLTKVRDDLQKLVDLIEG